MNVFAEMLLNEPAPMAIWVVLMLLTLPALVVLARPEGVRDPRRALLETARFVWQTGERRAARLSRRAAEVAQTVRYAEEVRVAATQATEAVDRWQAHWQAAADRVDATSAAWQAASARWARSRAAAAFGTPWTPRTTLEYAARERFLHQEVRAVVGRGELPGEAVGDALAGRAGWDPRLHPVAQELVVHRACAAYLERAHRAAVVAERAAWHDVQLARRSRDSLRREAVLAEARIVSPAVTRPAGRRAVLVPA